MDIFDPEMGPVARLTGRLFDRKQADSPPVLMIVEPGLLLRVESDPDTDVPGNQFAMIVDSKGREWLRSDLTASFFDTLLSLEAEIVRRSEDNTLPEYIRLRINKIKR